MANFPVSLADAELAGDALTRHLLGGRRAPSGDSFADVRRLYGPTTKAQTSAMARALVASEEYPGSRRYASARRRLERYETGATERRRPSAELVSLLGRLGFAGLLEPMLRDGLLMRIRASIKVSRMIRVHTMPAERGGRPTYQRIEGRALRGVADAWADGHTDTAGELVLGAFFDAYWTDAVDPEDFGPIEWVDIRPGAERRAGPAAA